MKTLSIAVFALFTGLACAPSPRTADRAIAGVPAPSDLAPFTRAHDEAWNAHDPTALADLFVDDAILVTPFGRRVEGRTALLELFAAPSPTKSTTSSSRVESVRSLGPDLALLTATQTLSGPGVEQLGSARATVVAVVRRVDRSWRFVEAHVFALPEGGAP